MIPGAMSSADCAGPQGVWLLTSRMSCGGLISMGVVVGFSFCLVVALGFVVFVWLDFAFVVGVVFSMIAVLLGIVAVLRYAAALPRPLEGSEAVTQSQLPN